MAGFYFSDHLAVLIAALLLNAAVGPRRVLLALHADWPGRQAANLVRFLEKRLNRERRDTQERRQRGVVLAVFLMALALVGGMLLGSLLAALQYGVVLEVVCVAACLSLRSTHDRARMVIQALAEEDPGEARNALEGTAWRNAALLDAHGLARACAEMLGMHFAAKVVAPCFWYALLGLPGVFASRMLTMLYEIVALNVAQNRAFGWGVYQIHRWAMAVPHALSALVLTGASCVSPTARPRQAARALVMQSTELTLDHAVLLPIPVMAAATDMALGGPASVYAGGDWVGRGTLRPVASDIRKAVFMYVLSGLLLLILLALLA